MDINPPPLAGDRAFDLATLVFYVYDHDEPRRRILDRHVLGDIGEPGPSRYVLR